MKITLEYSDTVVSVEKIGFDCDGRELIETFTRMMVVAGYSPSVVQFVDDDGGQYRYVGEDEEVVKRKEV